MISVVYIHVCSRLSAHISQVADTGDIEHGPGQLITLFKTPGTVHMTPRLQEWLHDIVMQLVALGYAHTISARHTCDLGMPHV